MSIETRIEKLEAVVKPQVAMNFPVFPTDPNEAARIYMRFIKESPGVSAPRHAGPAITPEEAARVYREFMYGSS